MENQFIPAGGKFPVNTTDLHIVKYVALGKLQRAENEEAATRLLVFSEQEGQYVGVPWNVVMIQYAVEFKEMLMENEKRSIETVNYNQRYNLYLKQRSVYVKKARFTFGISLLFTTKPTMPVFTPTQIPEKNYYSVMVELMSDPQELINAFWWLIKEGLVIKENHNDVDYFFPTPALVSRLMN